MDLRSQKYYLEKGWQVLFKYLNIPAQEVLRHAQLPFDLLLRKSPRVSADEYFRFWNGLAHVTQNEPTFSLQLINNIATKTTDPTIIAFMSSDNLNMALKRIAHYKPIIAPVRLNIEQNDHHTIVSFSGLSPNGPLPILLAIFELGFWVQLARTAIRENIAPAAVKINFDLPDIDKYEAFFGARINHDDFTSLTFSTVDAQKPFLTENNVMWSILESEFNKRMDDLTRDASFRDRVRACLVEILASGQYSMTYVAAKLAISNRTLQRRLHQEGTSFQKVLDELREELARHYLKTSNYTILEIAFLLGYDEPNSFFRAFRAWTGQTPESVRGN